MPDKQLKAKKVDHAPGKLNTTFSSVKHNQMVAVTGMRVWSMCEHHMLPFWCDVSVAYIAEDISDDLKKFLGTDNVAVMAKGEHLCMTMRGIRTPHRMISSSLDGQFLHSDTRAEFMALVNAN